MGVECLRRVQVVGDEALQPLRVWINAGRSFSGDANVGASAIGELWKDRVVLLTYALKYRPLPVKTVT
jgi:hypothetical protein